MEKILIPFLENEVAPRFDLTTDALVVTVVLDEGRVVAREQKHLMLERASAEAMCRLVLTTEAKTVICAGIAAEYYDFLAWKGVEVLDDVVGPVDAVLEAYLRGELKAGSMVK